MTPLTMPRLRAARLRAQLIDPRRARDPVDIVRHLVVVQSQDRFAASLGLRARGSGFTAADVERRRVDRRELVRTWLHRATIQLVAAEDLSWLLALLGPEAARTQRTRWRQLGLDDAIWSRARRILCRELAHGPRTRAELAERLRAGGVEPEGRRVPHLLVRGALEGLWCDGPDEGAERTWVLVQDWLGAPAGRAGEQAAGALAAGELARRYLRGHGPAGVGDFAWWSGLPMRAARAAFQAIAGELTEFRVGRETLVGLAEQPPPRLGPAGGTTLLPAFDAYLVAYRPPRAHALDKRGGAAVLAGGMFKPFLCRGGSAVGTWWPGRGSERLKVRLMPFSGALPPGTKAEVADLGRYTGLATTGVLDSDD